MVKCFEMSTSKLLGTIASGSSKVLHFKRLSDERSVALAFCSFSVPIASREISKSSLYERFATVTSVLPFLTDADTETDDALSVLSVTKVSIASAP